MRIRWLAVFLLCVSSICFAQTSNSDSRNLSMCMTGTYPALCNHNLLTPAQAQQVHDAEARHNLSMCMTGTYPALCNHNLLTPAASPTGARC